MYKSLRFFNNFLALDLISKIRSSNINMFFTISKFA